MADWDVVVVGAGAAGLMAGIRAAERGRRTLLVEKNRRPGTKVLMSGGTRCNLTHATDARGIVEAFGPQGRFLHSALSLLGPQDVLQFFEAEGVRSKLEQETGKIFPASDKALDVLNALVARLKRSGCALAYEEPLAELSKTESGFQLLTAKRTLTAAKVVLTTGGKSYPDCGTSGDGYRWAQGLGHAIVPPRPALVPLRTDAAWVTVLKGLTIPDMAVSILSPDGNQTGGKRAKDGVLARRRGALLFTHFGISGPVVLDVSRVVSGHPHPETLQVVCDFLPDTKPERLETELAEASARSGKRQVASIVAQWVPHRLAETMFKQIGLASDRRMAEVAKAERAQLVDLLKQLAIPITGTLGFKKAEVTAGGVPLAEVDSRSMQSKLVPGLFFAGELLDLDGPIGGYNFQAAFSTGYLAGENV